MSRFRLPSKPGSKYITPAGAARLRDELDMSPMYISMDAPLGKSLLGKRLDDEVSLELPAGIQTYLIVAIEYP